MGRAQFTLGQDRNEVNWFIHLFQELRIIRTIKILAHDFCATTSGTKSVTHSGQEGKKTNWLPTQHISVSGAFGMIFAIYVKTFKQQISLD